MPIVKTKCYRCGFIENRNPGTKVVDDEVVPKQVHEINCNHCGAEGLWDLKEQ